MNKTYRPIFFILIAALIIAMTLLPDFGAKERVPWRQDFAAARAEGERLHKSVFVEFTAPWCGYCKQMAHTTWADKSVAAAMETFVPVQVNIDANPNLAQQFNVNPIPAFVILDFKGNVLKFSEGYKSPQELLAWLEERPNGLEDRLLTPSTQPGMTR